MSLVKLGQENLRWKNKITILLICSAIPLNIDKNLFIFLFQHILQFSKDNVSKKLNSFLIKIFKMIKHLFTSCRVRLRHMTHVIARARLCTRLKKSAKKTCKKKARFVWLKKLQGMRTIARLKQRFFLSFTFYKTDRSYERIMCIYLIICLLFYWFNGEKCIIFTFSLHKGRQTSTD